MGDYNAVCPWPVLKDSLVGLFNITYIYAIDKPIGKLMFLILDVDFRLKN